MGYLDKEEFERANQLCSDYEFLGDILFSALKSEPTEDQVSGIYSLYIEAPDDIKRHFIHGFEDEIFEKAREIDQ